MAPADLPMNTRSLQAHGFKTCKQISPWPSTCVPKTARWCATAWTTSVSSKNARSWTRFRPSSRSKKTASYASFWYFRLL